MCGWFSVAMVRASRSKRSLNSLLETFTATMRSSRVSRALYTSPMPPAPICARISYGPSRSPVVRGMGKIQCTRLLPHHVRRVLFTFETHVFEQVRIQNNRVRQLHRPRLGVSFRIVDGHLDLHGPEVHAPEALRNARRVGERATIVVGPQAIAEPVGLDYQSVALPRARR